MDVAADVMVAVAAKISDVMFLTVAFISIFSLD
jgi:hypothetical protein